MSPTKCLDVEIGIFLYWCPKVYFFLCYVVLPIISSSDERNVSSNHLIRINEG